MRNKSSKIEILIPILTIFSDIVSIVSTYLLSYYLRFNSKFNEIIPVTEGVPDLIAYLIFIISTLPIWIIVFQSSKLYRLNRNVFAFDEFFVIVKCVTISIIFSLGIIFFIREFSYSRIVFIMIWVIAPFILMFNRYLILKLEKTFYNKNIGVKYAAIVGINENSGKIYDRFNKNLYTGIRVKGYFSRENELLEGEGKTYTRLGEYEDIPKQINNLGLHKLIICLPSNSHGDLPFLLKLCEGINIEFMMYPDYMEIITSKLKVEQVDGIPFMKIKSLPMNIWNRITKRLFDSFISIFILFVTSPFFIALAAIVKFTSKGPVFYKQERVGIDGKKFMMYKFRSMRTDSEKDGPKFASPDDDRTTPIGKFLRKYSLDELPQFINVLRGEMSIVGPRPERQFFVDQLKDNINNYLERHRVKCGITGWAQVNGLRGSSTSLQERINYDIYYIENWSVAFDIKIIVKTIKEALFSKNAY